MSKIPCKRCLHLEQNHVSNGCVSCYEAGMYVGTEHGLDLYCYEYTVPKDNLEFLEWAERCKI